VSEDNPARVIDVFMDDLDLDGLGIAVAPTSRSSRRLDGPRFR